MNVKTILLIIITTSNSLGQSEQTNELTSDGLKTGKWITRYDNGVISSIEYFKTRRRKPSAEELFVNNYQLRGFNKLDSTVHEEVRTGQWSTFSRNGRIQKTTSFSDDGIVSIVDDYEYDATNQLKVINRWQRKTYKTTYVKGNSDSVELSSIQFYLINSINDLVKVEIKIRNLSNKEIFLSLLPHSSLRFEPRDFKISKGDSADLVIDFNLPPGHINEKIFLSSKEWTLGLELRGFGYHLDVSSFKEKERIQLPRTFYFYKTGGEYQMEIIKKRDKFNRTFIPVSKQILTMDLRPGTYNITLVGPSEKLTKEIEIK
jgi:hypothetical protein